jgi:hypothetical protein
VGPIMSPTKCLRFSGYRLVAKVVHNAPAVTTTAAGFKVWV